MTWSASAKVLGAGFSAPAELAAMASRPQDSATACFQLEIFIFGSSGRRECSAQLYRTRCAEERNTRPGLRRLLRPSSVDPGQSLQTSVQRLQMQAVVCRSAPESPYISPASVDADRCL